MSYSPLPIIQTNIAGAISLILSGDVGSQAVVLAETAVARTTAMMELTRDVTAVAAGAHVIGISHSGGGDAINIALDGDVTAEQGIVIAETAFDRDQPMMEMTRDALASGHLLALTNNGLGHGIDLNHNGNADALNIFLAGLGTSAQAAFVSESAVARTTPLFQISRNAAVVAPAAHVFDITNNGTLNSTFNIAHSGGGPAINVTAAATILSGTQGIQTSGSPTALLITGAAHTTLAASTEASLVDINGRQIVEFATGDFALQRNVQIQQPTYGAVGPSVIRRAATLGVEGGPIADANMTFGVTGDEGESLSIYAEGRILSAFGTGGASSTDHGMRLEGAGILVGTAKIDSPMVVYDAGAINAGDAGGAPRRLGFGVGTRATAANPTTADLHWYFQKASALLEAGWGTEIMTLEQTGRLTVNDLQVSAAQALGGGAAPTFGTIGGAGPAVAAQNEWVQIDTENGVRFAAVWA